MARLRRFLRAGVRDQRGVAAVLFAVSLLLLVPLTLGVFEVYYGSEQRGKLQDSLDAAALFAARSTATSPEDLTAIGLAALNANLKLRDGAVLKSVEFSLVDDKVVAVAKLQPASLMAPNANFWRYPDMTVTTEVNRSMDKLEIALVLDNTGSMAGTKLSTLKTAAKNLVDKLEASSAASAEVDPIKISLVPFSNTVRVQSWTSLASYDPASASNAGIPSWIDPKGKSHQVGSSNKDIFSAPNTDRFQLIKALKDKNTGVQLQWAGCVEARPKPYDVQEDTPTSAIAGTMYIPHFWPDEADNNARPTKFYPTGSSTYFNAGNNDYLDDAPTWSSSITYGIGDVVGYAATWSSSVNYTTGNIVFRSNAYWKALSNNKNKTPSSSSSYWTASAPPYYRALTASTNKVPSSSPTQWVAETFRDPAMRQANWVKYGTTPSGTAMIDSGNNKAGYPFGPNSGCGLQPIVRLTTSMGTVKTAIDAMTAVGETHIPLGLAWGWNTLSPVGPLADGAAYGTVHNRKIVILMTDGENTLSNPSGANEPNGSIYGGYGYIWQGLLGMTQSTGTSTRTSTIDARLSLLCTNMKAKGITLYTVRVEVTTGSSTLLENCATRPDMFYDVQNVSQLSVAFDAIARSIDNLRISK